MHVTPKVRRKGICYVKPVQKILLYAVIRFLIESGTKADIFFVGDALAVTPVELGSDTTGTRT